MQESELYQYWQYYARTRQLVHTGERRIRVLNAGRFNQSRGPDFVSARFELDGVVYQGDVEFHLNANDWYRHQHHLDRAFANVLLHLVSHKSESSSKEIIHNLTGQAIPTFVLPAPPQNLNPVHPARQCLPGADFKSHLFTNLQNLARQRLQTKIRQFLSALEYQSVEQVFYSNFLRSLGYPHNSRPFQQLAERLDWSWLTGWLGRIWANPQVLYALYAGHAGFIPRQPGDDYNVQLLSIYQKFRSYLNTAALSENQWQFASTRPANHPHFRLAAWVYLLYKRSTLPYSFLWQIFSERKSFSELYKNVLSYFNVPTDTYWKNHFAIGRIYAGKERRAFWGQARINELLLNVILPLFSAQAIISGSAGFSNYLEHIFLWIPARQSYQSLTKNMPWSDECRSVWKGQAMDQALLHLQNNYCLLNGCQECPLQRYA